VNLDGQARMLANRVRKSFRKLSPAFERQGIGAFRLYDRDIPEIRAAVDWYEGHLVVAEYEREQTRNAPWLATVARAAAEALEVPWERVHLKVRHSGEKYARLAHTGRRLVVRERDLRFAVNLDDYIDTGLFNDHRDTRARVRAEAAGSRFLNLFSYTGSFTCAAAAGGALQTTSVDASRGYQAWAGENLRLNGQRGELVRSGVEEFLRGAGSRRWTLCMLDPPSFSDRGGAIFEVERDHRPLIERALAVLQPGGILWFATNHQRFVPDLAGLRFTEEDTVPVDYRNRGVHRAFRILRK
jgi:23S rRNA (guanine2069-N7)-methyltransferase